MPVLFLRHATTCPCIRQSAIKCTLLTLPPQILFPTASKIDSQSLLRRSRTTEIRRRPPCNVQSLRARVQVHLRSRPTDSLEKGTEDAWTQHLIFFFFFFLFSVDVFLRICGGASGAGGGHCGGRSLVFFSSLFSLLSLFSSFCYAPWRGRPFFLFGRGEGLLVEMGECLVLLLLFFAIVAER